MAMQRRINGADQGVSNCIQKNVPYNQKVTCTILGASAINLRRFNIMTNLSSKNKKSLWVDTLFFAVVVIAISIFSAALYLLSNKVDDLAIQREQSQLENSLKDALFDLEVVATSVGDWDEAVRNLDNNYSRDWAATNIGHYFCTTKGINDVFILDRNDQIIYAMRNNQDIDISSFEPVRAISGPILKRIRDTEERRGAKFVARVLGGFVAEPVQGSDLVKIGDDLVIVTFTLVQPDFGVSLPIGPRSPIIVTGKVIDKQLMQRYSDRLMLSNLHLASAHDTVDARVNLTNQAGAILGQLAWTPNRPAGHLIQLALIPMLLGIGSPLLLYFYSLRTSRLLRKTVDDLVTSEERWKFALEGSGEGVWDWDMLTNKVQYSKRWKEMLGYSEDEITDALEEWSTRVHPDDLPGVMADVNANMEGKTVSFSNEHRFRQKDGSYKWILDRGMVVQRDESGQPTRMIGTHSDISERKQLDRIKSEFISTVSHELRTPLTSIRGALGLLEAGTVGEIPPKAMAIVNIANRNSERLILLVNDILDMEKLLSGKMVYNMEPINLGNLLNLSIESNAAYAANYSVKYRLINVGEEIIMADSNRLHQVLANMMSNAAKFSPPNAIVDIGYTRNEQFIRVTVEDHGPGIPDEFRDRIFAAFSQANSTNGRKHGGTGLGLNISKKLMQDMGGEMGYVTLTGENSGTTFWIDLIRQDGCTNEAG